jgi:hypothetical protein
MARMIPPTYASVTRSPGERDLFERLRDAEGTEAWTVLHSLDLSDHVERIAGEADFVVIVPELGVAVLEVKAHETIEYEDGVWLMGRNRKPDERGPFKQAAEAMHSLRTFVRQHSPRSHSVPFIAGVVFPYVNFGPAPASPEWQSWQLIDAADLSARGIASCVIGLLRQGRQQLLDKTSWFRDQPVPDVGHAQQLAEAMRPNFEVHESPRQRLKRLDAEVLRYTTLQARALDLVWRNDRVIIDGPAGTGKTVLAVEIARRSALAGDRVLLLCFNQLLAGHLTAEVADQPGVTVRTIHAFMREVAKETGDPEDPAYWRDVLPDRAVDALLGAGEPPFDVVVIDEAQDMSFASYLDVLDLSITQGLSGGRWWALGDFENQAIFRAHGEPSFDDLVRSRGAAAAELRLTENCRNTQSIGTFAESAGQLRLRYSRVLRETSGVDAELRYYPDGEGVTYLEEALADLKDEGLGGSQTVVLSARRDGLVSQLDPARRVNRFEEAPVRTAGRIGTSTIQRFKGLECSAAVVTDIADVNSDRSRQLLYVASTRAKHRLIVLLHEREREAVLQILANAGGPSAT